MAYSWLAQDIVCSIGIPTVFYYEPTLQHILTDYQCQSNAKYQLKEIEKKAKGSTLVLLLTRDVIAGIRAKYLTDSQMDFEDRRSDSPPHPYPHSYDIFCDMTDLWKRGNTRANLIDKVYWKVRQEYEWTKRVLRRRL